MEEAINDDNSVVSMSQVCMKHGFRDNFRQRIKNAFVFKIDFTSVTLVSLSVSLCVHRPKWKSYSSSVVIQF